MTEGGFYAYLDQQARTRPLRAKKRDEIKAIAQSTGQKLLQSKILKPQSVLSLARSISKHRYPEERSNRGQPGLSKDVYSAKFQLKTYETVHIEKIEIATNFTKSASDLCSNSITNFAHCVLSDLAKSAGIATQFVRIFADFSELGNTHLS